MPSINARAALAGDASTPTAALRELAADQAPKVRQAVAANPSTPAEVLRALVDDTNWHVRFAIAENPSRHALAVAVAASDPDVRGRAAQRDDLDDTSTRLLLEDPAHSVRERMADVAQAPHVVAALARDPHPAVRATILHNPSLSVADVEMLADDPIARVRSSAAGARRVHPDTLTRLAGDRSANARWSVLVNNPERLDLARVLANDADATNAGQAAAQLADPRRHTAYLGEIDLID